MSTKRTISEVVWDYPEGGEEWSGCKLVGGVAKKKKKMVEVAVQVNDDPQVV